MYRNNRTFNILQPQTGICLLMLWLQVSSILCTTLSKYRLNEFSPPSEVDLYHITIYKDTGDVYVGGYNELFKLSNSLSLVNSSSTCTSEDDCDNINKVLVIDYDNDKLITCGGGYMGRCEERSLSSLQSSTTATQLPVVGVGSLSAIGFIAPSESGNELYTASSDDGTQSSFFFISRRDLNTLNYGTGESAIKLNSQGDYQKKFLQYISGFSHDGFSYFVSNRQIENTNDLITSRLSRVCESGSSLHTFSEVYLTCEGYEYVKDMSVGSIGHDLAVSLGLQAGDKVLYGVFMSTSSIGSAVCIFTFDNISLAFSKALEGCLSVGASGNNLLYANGNICPHNLDPLTDSQLQAFMCDGSANRYKYSQGLQSDAISAQPVLKLSNINSSAIAIVTERNHTIAFIGTEDGCLIKAQIVSTGASRVYEEFPLNSGSVRSDLLVSADYTQVTVLTEKKVLQLRVENCAQYTTCNECIGPNAGEDGDPYCGWCTLENKCSREEDCTTVWLPYNNAACPSIRSVQPAALLYTQANKTITLDIQELPPLTESSFYECKFNGGSYTSRMTVGENITCTSPPENKIPSIQGQSITIDLAISSSEIGINFLTTEFVYYDCERIQSCSICLDGFEECRWCLNDNLCKSGSCGTDVDVTNKTHCPRIIHGSELVPANVEKEVVVETRNIPKGKEYKCVVEIEGNIVQVRADLDGDNVICNATKYEYGSGAENKNVSMRIQWGSNTIDNNYTLILYKCAVNRPDCSRCMSDLVTPAVYDCAWCDSSCKYNGSCKSISDVCGAPEIIEVMPKSLAITVATPSSERDVITIKGNDLGLSEYDILNITVYNQLCDIVSDSFDVFDQSIMCVAPICQRPEDCEQAEVVVTTLTGISNSYTQLLYQNPVITEFNPKEGILSGGTTIYITGELLTTGSSLTVKIGEADCIIDSVTDTNINCTTSVSDSVGEAQIIIYFGTVSRNFSRRFNYISDPEVIVIEPENSICSGGRDLAIAGTGFDAVQDVTAVITVDNIPYIINCAVISDTLVSCQTPKLPVDKCPTNCDGDLSVEMNIEFDGYVYNHTNAGKKFKYKTDPTYYPFNNSIYSGSNDGRLELTSRQLELKGKNLNCASSKENVEVLVGGKSCVILSLLLDELQCRTEQESFSDDVVTVKDGNYYKILGKVNNPKNFNWVVVGVCVGFFIFILVAAIFFKRREQIAERGHKNLLLELDTMVSEVTTQAVDAIAEMTLNLGDLAQDLDGHGMPFRGPKEYAMMMMFSGYDSRPREADAGEREQEGLTAFSRLLLNKDFLVIFIDIINNSKMFNVREKGNFASLLALEMVIEGKLNDLTTVLQTLVRSHIDDMVTDRKAKQVLRRNEGVTEKLLSNWVCLCMYSHLQEHNARPLYLMYQAIRCYVNKGPVDAVTHHSKHSLSLNTLLREDIEYEEITVDVIIENEQVMPVKLLSCDTITQVKEKILDMLFKNKPYSQRRPAKDVDLGHLILRDLDNTSKVKGNKKQLNTMKHFKIRNGYRLTLVPKQDNPNVRISQGYESLFGLENEGFNGAFDPESVISADEIDVELGPDIFHLVEVTEDNEKSGRSDQPPKKKTIDELFFPRVLATKQTILEHVQNMFHSILQPASDEHSPPLAIKFLFDLFDREQRKHKVGQDVLKAWKNQSLCERFWITVINHPEFLFDIPKTYQVRDALSVISNAFTDSCATNQLHYSKHTDAHRLLYAKEIPTYRDLVDNFYESIQRMPGLDHMEMERQLKDTAMRFQGLFSRNSILELLYSYERDCHKEILKAVENDDSCTRSRIGLRLEQIPQMMNN